MGEGGMVICSVFFDRLQIGLVQLDVNAAKVYRKYSIEPEFPAKGDFV